MRGPGLRTCGGLQENCLSLYKLLLAAVPINPLAYAAPLRQAAGAGLLPAHGGACPHAGSSAECAVPIYAPGGGK